MTRNLLTGLCVIALVSFGFVDSSFGDDELYLWTISGSSIDPFVSVATPEVGFYSLYVWFACSAPGGRVAIFRLGGSLTDRVVGVNGIAPFTVSDVYGNGDLIVNFHGCWTAPLPAFEVLVIDEIGTGGSLCLEETLSSPFVNETFECTLLETFPNAVIGFASDGTSPCEIGSCVGPISLESGNWGSIKGLYR